MAVKKIPIVIVGAGGHAKVLADMINAGGNYLVMGATDRAPAGAAAKLSGLKLLGDDKILPRLKAKGVRHAAIGLGASPNTAPRAALHRILVKLGFKLPSLVHPRAILSPAVVVAAGAQIMAGAVINPGVRIGAGAVVNTGAVVEHDCDLGEDSFVGPRVVLGGEVRVGDGAFIGLGATVNPGLEIGPCSIIGAGAVVIEDVRGGTTVFGVPALERNIS